ncbi:MAG TPA: dienelactone hydrolase family protein [Thermomicrobiales bacterium]|nr:dienelactone hydrolase family protein [Thermomicrobiales bacterium]
MSEASPQLPHTNAPVYQAGAALDDADLFVIMLHGRGATGENILGLAGEIVPNEEALSRIAWLAPQAAGGSWYPYPFLYPLAQNEPWLSGALAAIDRLIDHVRSDAPDRAVVIVGFSQGACLALEYLARGSRPVSGVAAFSGGLIGPSLADRQPIGDLTGSWVFIGCGDKDGHIPIEVAEQSGRLLADAGAAVDFRRYEGMGHTIVEDETAAVRARIGQLLAGIG